jgi:uncharacterized Zn-binding protein involved in type VI secretion
MPRQARLGDAWMGRCFAHDGGPIAMTGWLVQGSAVCSSDGLSEVRLGDLAVGRCGHTGVVVTASSVVFDDAIPVAEIGDRVRGDIDGHIVEGSFVSDFY